MWANDVNALKSANISIHVIATGAGAGLQQMLWQVPGSSAYLSGCSFPYDQSETEELLGFKPEHFVSQETAIDLASAAYMKAYRFGGKKPVGIGITASVASEVLHKGDHRFNVCVITDDKVLTDYVILDKGIGIDQRVRDGVRVDMNAFMLMYEALGIGTKSSEGSIDATDLARARFLRRPFFTANGYRLEAILNSNDWALMPGAFNPPHVGHLSMATEFEKDHSERVVFEVSTTPPHKDKLSVQDMLKRAKLLQGHNRIFTTDMPMYLDKAKAYPGMSILLGTDALVRMLDPKWGIDPSDLISQFWKLHTRLYVAARTIDNKLVHVYDILAKSDEIFKEQHVIDEAYWVLKDLPGRWDISSTELRNKIK
jgi:nicotinic acid mononucleotide adenylyltransferase